MNILEENCNVKTIAQLFGISVRRVQQLTQDGVIETVTGEHGRKLYNLGDTVSKYTTYLADKAYGRSKNAKEADLKEKKLEAEIALKESQGELHRLRTDIASGKYISVEEVQLDYAKFFVIFKKMAMAIPGRVGGLLGGQVDPVIIRHVEKDISNTVNNMLNSFIVAGQRESVDK